MTFREKLEIWLDNPNTPTDAWMRLSFPEIDKQVGVNPHNVCVQLPKIIPRSSGAVPRRGQFTISYGHQADL